MEERTGADVGGGLVEVEAEKVGRRVALVETRRLVGGVLARDAAVLRAVDWDFGG